MLFEWLQLFIAFLNTFVSHLIPEAQNFYSYTAKIHLCACSTSFGSYAMKSEHELAYGILIEHV